MEEKTKNLFRITTDRMYTALESFYVWRTLSKMVNTNEVGLEQAERNVEILKKYWDFFHTVQVNSYKGFVIDLSIFFDAEKYEDTFSLKKVIEAVKEKIEEAEYVELSKKIEEIKKKHGVKIGFILELRNAEVGHQEVDRKSRLVIYKEIEELFEGVQEILNLLAKYHDGSFTVWDHLERNVAGSLEWVIDNLERGERIRIEEIYKEYKI